MVKRENKLSWTMIGLICLTILLGESIFNPMPARGFKILAVLTWGIFALVSLSQIVVEIRKKKRLDQQREAAALGEIQKQAQEQPLADIDTLTLPLRIQYIPRIGMWIGFLSFCTLVFLLLEIVIILLALKPGNTNRDFLITTAIIFPIILMLLWVGTWRYRSRQWLEAGEDGLTMRTLMSKKTIRWKDARLFAVHAPITAHLSLYATNDIFELSSAKSIIHWEWKKERFSSQWSRTRVRDETQRQQMQGLLSIIRAKTDLPLYDLR